jgi:hypothetical protein
MSYKNRIAAFAVLAGLAGASSVSAAPVWPTNIVGTWSGLSNLSQIVLTVSQQTAGGKCQSISGSIQDVATGAVGNMLGYYCPGSGAVEFLRYPTGSNVAFQVYAGSLSQKPAPKGSGLLMGGTFGQYSPSYGPVGQYSFALTN